MKKKWSAIFIKKIKAPFTNYFSPSMIVVPGEKIVRDSGLIRGHGTYSLSGSLVSSQAGSVEQVNKLVHVRPTKKRYIGEIGDIVVGRVNEVGSKTWKLDLQGTKSAVLHLSSINLPGGEQRMRNYSDQLQMRRFFEEGWYSYFVFLCTIILINIHMYFKSFRTKHFLKRKR